MNDDEINRLLNPHPEEIPLEEFGRNAREHIGRLREMGRPAILTVDGKRAVVVQSAGAYQRLFDAVDRPRRSSAFIKVSNRCAGARASRWRRPFARSASARRSVRGASDAGAP